MEGFGSSYLLNRMVWMPNFGQFSRTPSFLTRKKGTRFDQLFSQRSTHVTWYESFAEKCFAPGFIFASQIVEPLYELVLKYLVEFKILKEIPVRGDAVWGICADALQVTSEVCQLRCKACEHNISVAQKELHAFAGAPCQRFHCQGSYAPVDAKMDYYGIGSDGRKERGVLFL